MNPGRNLRKTKIADALRASESKPKVRKLNGRRIRENIGRTTSEVAKRPAITIKIFF